MRSTGFCDRRCSIMRVDTRLNHSMPCWVCRDWRAPGDLAGQARQGCEQFLSTEAAGHARQTAASGRAPTSQVNALNVCSQHAHAVMGRRRMTFTECGFLTRRGIRPAKPIELDLSLTQIDPATLAELPDDVRQELLRTLAAPKPGAQRVTAANAAALAEAAQQQGESADAADEPVRLHVADVDAVDEPFAPSGPLLRDMRGLDAAQWRQLSDLFPADLLDELLQSSAVEGWSIIEQWLNQVVLSPNDADARDATGSHLRGSCELRKSDGVPNVRPEQVEAIQQLLTLWATSFVRDDLEGISTVLCRQQQLAKRWPSIASACAACAATVQAAVRRQYGASLRV